jgi:3-hydroxyisobutyrate dehydrogenase-like beta-hydroxyacid dehydrogenase
MKNRKPICLPKWVDDDGLQVIMNKETRNIGWIGLGETGHSLVFQLIRSGYNVTVFDKDKKKTADLEKFGAKVARTANDLAA